MNYTILFTINGIRVNLGAQSEKQARLVAEKLSDTTAFDCLVTVWRGADVQASFNQGREVRGEEE